MIIKLDELFETGEQIILDSSIRGRHCNNWLRDIYRVQDLNSVNMDSLSLAKQSILTSFSDYNLGNVATVQGVISELRNYANCVRKKKLYFEKNQRPREEKTSHPVLQELARIHTGLLALTDLAKTKLYDPESPQYKKTLEVIRGIQYTALPKKLHKRETDLHVVTSGIHSANYLPTHIISTDFDITKLTRAYMQGKSTPYGLACYYVVSCSEAERTV